MPSRPSTGRAAGQVRRRATSRAPKPPSAYSRRRSIGAGRVDFLINNAGRSWNVDTAEIDEDTTQLLIELNFKSVVRLARAYVSHARRRDGGGAIVQISSTAGIAGFERRAVYGATKFAVIGLTKVLALDHARDGIRVNAVLPHVVDTEMFRDVAKPEEAERWRAGIPMGRFATVEDVAATGRVFVLAGGKLSDRRRLSRRWRIPGRPVRLRLSHGDVRLHHRRRRLRRLCSRQSAQRRSAPARTASRSRWSRLVTCLEDARGNRPLCHRQPAL